MDLNQENTDCATGLKITVASVSLPSLFEEDDLSVYKPMYVIHQSHTTVWQ